MPTNLLDFHLVAFLSCVVLRQCHECPQDALFILIHLAQKTRNFIKRPRIDQKEKRAHMLFLFSLLFCFRISCWVLSSHSTSRTSSRLGFHHLGVLLYSCSPFHLCYSTTFRTTTLVEYGLLETEAISCGSTGEQDISKTSTWPVDKFLVWIATGHR